MVDKVLVLKEDSDPWLCLRQIEENLQPVQRSMEIADHPVLPPFAVEFLSRDTIQHDSRSSSTENHRYSIYPLFTKTFCLKDLNNCCMINLIKSFFKI
jgi:hypothetical protein